MVTIATSIMPLRIEAQQVAINSWLGLGFSVVSVNVPGEVEHLHAEFPGVRFATITRQESGQNERPNVALSEIFPLLAAANGRVCGIVNSDISFRVGNDFLAFIKENASGGMVFGSRIDVDCDNHEPEREYCLGFDYFFFDKELIPLFPSNEFYLGLPYWDYLLPIVLLAKSVTVKRLISPVAYHLNHYSSWEQYLEVFGRNFLENLKCLSLADPAANFFSGRFLESIKAADIDKCSEITHFMLRYVVHSLSYPHTCNDDACVTINKTAFEDMIAMLLVYEERLSASDCSLAAVYGSRSWRLTKYLRMLKSKVKGFIRPVDNAN